jgi:hypothetical protein
MLLAWLFFFLDMKPTIRPALVSVRLFGAKVNISAPLRWAAESNYIPADSHVACRTASYSNADAAPVLPAWTGRNPKALLDSGSALRWVKEGLSYPDGIASSAEVSPENRSTEVRASQQ